MIAKYAQLTPKERAKRSVLIVVGNGYLSMYIIVLYWLTSSLSFLVWEFEQEVGESWSKYNMDHVYLAFDTVLLEIKVKLIDDWSLCMNCTIDFEKKLQEAWPRCWYRRVSWCKVSYSLYRQFWMLEPYAISSDDFFIFSMFFHLAVLRQSRYFH